MGQVNKVIKLPIEENNGAIQPEGDLKYLAIFLKQYGNDIRFCSNYNKWLIWNGTRWEFDETLRIEKLAQDTVNSLYKDASMAETSDQRRELSKKARGLDSATKIKSLISLARSNVPILPSDLDKNSMLLNCENGTLNLETFELQKHERTDLLTKIIPTAYNPGATSPMWEEFLNQIFEGNQELISFMRRSIGYSLTGNIMERALFILHGEGSNGKSTLIDTITLLLGDYAMVTPVSTLMQKHNEGIPNDIARLKGARFVSASEAEQGQRLAESFIKAVTGGEKIPARFMRAEFFEFYPEFKLFLGTNHKPIIRGTDKAIWNRIRLIPFKMVFPVTEEGKKLKERLATELPGILNWALQGCREWQASGLQEPPEVKSAVSGYRAEMDVIGSFIEDECVTFRGASVGITPFYKAYSDWCDENGERPIKSRDFTSQLRERGFEQDKGSKGMRFWNGIGLNAKSDIPDNW